MPNLKNLCRRNALSFVTVLLAVCIGFAMQTSEAAILVDEGGAKPPNSTVSIPLPKDLALPQFSKTERLPSLPDDHGHGVALLPEPVLIAVADDIPVGILPVEETTPRFGCVPTISAEAAAGALIDVSLLASCYANETVMFTHDDLIFHMQMPAEGVLKVQVPALAEVAKVSASFAIGDKVTATTVVDSLPFYDRVVISWSGRGGTELHAREFGAQYGELGHVWRGQPRDVGALSGGEGGFLIRLGTPDLSIAGQAEVYTFPTGISSQVGDVAVSVETEVTEENCGTPLKIKSSALRQGQVTDQHEMILQVPDCSAIGEFLVLKNLVEDLTIAQN